MAKSKKRARTSGRQATKPRVRPFFRPRVVVKFADWVVVPYVDGAEKSIGERYGFGPWRQIVAEHGALTLVRLYTSLPAERIQKLVEDAAQRDDRYKRPNLLTWFTVDCPEGLRADELAKRLQAWDVVEKAYPDAPAGDPVVTPGDDVRFPNQGYLDPAPDGIDAQFAWTVAGGDGSGQRVIDLEQGWTLNHEDLNAHGPSLLFGVLVDGSRPHGTAVLGEICAVDNALGCVGIAPNVAGVDVVSHSGSTANVPDAILAAVDTLEFGNVLLLEVQTVPPDPFGAPVEIRDDVFEAIRLASALGIIVVEAGGNGANNLDTITNAGGLQVLNPASANFRDSGAIIVGAASSTVPHTRMNFSSFGARVNCYAWGENVDTCSSNAGGSTTLYTGTFNGTSSASPIITGAALAVQGALQAAVGFRLGPIEMRALLGNAATGTASNNPAIDRIGVMPNLQAILPAVTGAGRADVYVRDFAGDTGDPHAGSISASPDVILRPLPVPDPQLAYGEGSMTENSATLGYEAEAGQNNSIYVRVRNRGSAAAGATVATVYWSEVSALVTPDMWTLVGSTALPAVPSGDVLTVSDEIVWPAAEIPAEGHYCFAATLDTAGDPAPLLTDLMNFDNFRLFIRNNNNVTWRNFNVANHTPDIGDPAAAFPFLIAGAPDRRALMALEVIAKLPAGARLWLEAPISLLRALNARGAITPVKGNRELGRIACLPNGLQRIGAMHFPAKFRARPRIIVELPKEVRRQSGYEVIARQVFVEQGLAEEVGRVTWHLVSPEFLARRQQIEECLFGKPGR
jgi:serine protease